MENVNGKLSWEAIVNKRQGPLGKGRCCFEVQVEVAPQAFVIRRYMQIIGVKSAE